MRRDSQSITSADESGLAPLPPAPPGLEELVAAVRTAVSRPAERARTAAARRQFVNEARRQSPRVTLRRAELRTATTNEPSES